eukprot:2494161-Lingulodinium_polyedra.AAC.1
MYRNSGRRDLNGVRFCTGGSTSTPFKRTKHMSRPGQNKAFERHQVVRDLVADRGAARDAADAALAQRLGRGRA